jgi:hypothetical protein
LCKNGWNSRFYTNKTDNNRWVFSEYDDSEQIISLESIDFEISLIDIYDKVNFNEQE